MQIDDESAQDDDMMLDGGLHLMKNKKPSSLKKQAVISS